MQVIVELIDYLRRRGLLSNQELRLLQARGFVDHVECSLHDDESIDEIDPAEELAETLPEHHPRGRRGGGDRGTASSGAPTAVELSDSILERWNECSGILAPLEEVARMYWPVADLSDALRSLAEADKATLEDIVTELLGAGPTPLAAIWHALGFDGYAEWQPPERRKGMSYRAVSAIIAGATFRDLGRYGSVMRLAGFARLYRLVRAQRELLGAFGRVLAGRPGLYERVLNGWRVDSLCYWSLAIAITARANLADVAALGMRLHVPSRPDPDAETLRRAWACAAAMDARSVARLLSDRRKADIEIVCPVAWDASVRSISEEDEWT